VKVESDVNIKTGIAQLLIEQEKNAVSQRAVKVQKINTLT